MLPAAYVMLERLPLTPNGKLDRKALPTPERIGDATADSDQPTNLLELELAHIWQQLFGRQGIGRFDNFFDLGGHSLLAVRLSAEIEKRLGRKLPITALFQSPTIASLAQRFGEKNWEPRWSSLVPLQPLGERPPLYIPHGWGGGVFGFLTLARRLPPDQPTYGLQALGLDGVAPRHTSIESMATHYVEEILSFQPEGPYYLGGYSMGGLIAYEMAQQMHRLGHRIALLALFDTAPIGGIRWTIYARIMASYLGKRCLVHLQRCWNMSIHDRPKFVRGRWSVLKRLVADNRSKPVAVTASPPVGTEPPEVPGFQDYYHAVASTYRVQSYPGTADLFVSDDAKPHWVYSWRQLVRGGISLHPVPAKHLQLLSSEYVPCLAKTFTPVLQRAQDREQSGLKARRD
jgi:thioesterase domain-containing protein/acyl carrier protein